MYGSLFSIFVLCVFAWLLHDESHRIRVIDGNWVAMAVLGGFFAIICFGMSANGIRLGMMNKTQIEELQRVHCLAIHINDSGRYGGRTIAYPLRPSNDSESSRRTFAIVQTRPSDNPWDLNSRLNNLKSIMGQHYFEWLLPTYGPCCRHDALESFYALDVERLKNMCGIR